MRTLIILALAAAAPAAAVAERPTTAPKNIVWHSKYDTAYRQMQAENRPMLVFVKSNACLYCKRMESQTYNHPAVIRDVQQSFVPAVINSANEPVLAQQLGARVYPTTVIISADGRIMDTIPGFVTADEFRSRLQKAKVR